MPSYVVTGASRGLGYGFIKVLSQQPNNLVIGLVRNKEATDAKIAADNLKNIHIIQADITDLASLEGAKAQIEKLTPSIDYLINNAAFLPGNTAFKKLTDFTDNPKVLEDDLRLSVETNVLGVIWTTNTFLPLVRKSSIKKVITISSGMADISFVNDYEIFEGGPYTISKAAVNTVVAKYNAALKHEGILFLAISPGFVNTGADSMPPPDSELPKKFMRAYPHFKGGISPEESVEAVMGVVDKASVDNEFAGAFVSHLGNQQWL
ncbi:hypothetical protein PMZ80_007229 [Knufia obscura]|uniref:NAD(P)-binding protein n=2 Tax=Knufia TaxID=430999 RepID=A0AAN8I5N1_9EURO|nr:hypothetical protein PMZ80_007229 [Knufia obscura]KAK5953239.1 hypothetical protein OHC33_005807 [Knufia fluminis]